MRQAFHVAARDWIEIIGKHNNRHGGTRRVGRLKREFGTASDEHIRLRSDQIVGSCEGFGNALIDPSMFNEEILTFGEAELMQFGAEDW
jgi:hypothetical protein